MTSKAEKLMAKVRRDFLNHAFEKFPTAYAVVVMKDDPARLKSLFGVQREKLPERPDRITLYFSPGGELYQKVLISWH